MLQDHGITLKKRGIPELQVQNNFIKSSGESPACLIIGFRVPIGISL